MANTVRKAENGTVSTPIVGMVSMAIAGGLLVGCSFVVIQYWPLPVAVAPYFEDALFPTGFGWGFVVGALIGLIIGYLTDESHFIDATYE